MSTATTPKPGQKVSSGKTAPAAKTAPAQAAPATAQHSDLEPGSYVFVTLNLSEGDDGEVYIDDELNNRYISDDPTVEEERIANLAASIESSEGLLQPIVVYRSLDERRVEHSKPYELNSGFRRTKALRRLAETTGEQHWVTQVPARVMEHKPAHQRKITQLIENLQRQDLSPMEIANSFKEVIDSGMFTVKQLANQVGWPVSTVTNYVKAASLDPDVQDMIHRGFHARNAGDRTKEEGTLSWSAGKELSGYVERLNLNKEQQVLAAKMASGMHVSEFAAKLEELYGKPDAAKTDEATTPTTQPEQPQRKPAVAKRANELKDRYLPFFMEKVKVADRKDKPTWEARVDAINWVLNNTGTTLGAELSPWEEEQRLKAEENKKSEEETRLRDKYVKQAISMIKKKLSEQPPLDAPDRKMATLPEGLEIVKQDVISKLERGKAEGQPEGYMLEGFAPGDIAKFIEHVSAKFHEDQASAKKRKEEKEAKAAKEEAEAAEKAKADAAASAQANSSAGVESTAAAPA